MQERRERLLQEPRTAEQARDLLRGLERLLQEASFVLLVYRRLLLRGWLIRGGSWRPRPGSLFSGAVPGFPVATVEDEHHRPQLQLAGEAPGIIRLIRRLEVRDLLPDIQLGRPTLLRSQTVRDANTASSAQT
jgi:hypothetical protein